MKTVYFLFKNGLRWDFQIAESSLPMLFECFKKKGFFTINEHGVIDLSEVVGISVQK